MSERKSIFRSASVIGVFTVISRITGFVRDILLAGAFGTGLQAQAFFVAFRIPNMFRDVMGEGAGNAAFVPVFCEYLERRRREDFLRLINNVFILLCAVSAAIVVLGMLAAPLIIRLVAPGFLDSPAKFNLTVELNRILFPYLALITISAFLMAVANATKSFAVPAASPIAFNLVMIAGLLGLSWVHRQNVYYVSLIVLAAGLAQIWVQIPPLVKSGGLLFRRAGAGRPWRDEGVRQIGALLIPRLVGTSVYQLNLFIDTIVASLAFLVGEGAVAAIYYANRIVQLPFAILGVALSNAALPTMSALAAQKDYARLRDTLTFCLKCVFIGLTPVMLLVLLLARPLVTAVYQRGSFDAYSTSITATALAFYALGLLSYASVRFLSHAFYALQDTRTPVKTAAAALAVNVALIILLVAGFHTRLAGLALASSLSATVNFVMLYRRMRLRLDLRWHDVVKGLWHKVAVASMASAGCAVALLMTVLGGRPTLAAMGTVLAAAAGVYLGMLWLLRVREMEELIAWISRKK